MRPRQRPPGAVAGLLVLLAPLWVLAARQALTGVLPWSPAPDALVLAAAVAAWCAPPGRAALFAAVAGCLADASADVPFGLLGARLAFLVAVFAPLRRGVEGGVVVHVLLVLAFALLERGLAVVALAATAPGSISVLALLPRAGASALWSAALAPLGFAVARVLLGDPQARGAHR